MAKAKEMSRAELPKGYENKMVILLMFTFGFVMFDRFALANLAPYWLPELNMTAADLGLSMSVFAVTWAIVGFFGSYLADSKVSRKLILAIAVIAFSLCSFLTGTIQGLVSLLVIRAVMGCAEGPVMPVSQSFIIPQSSPNRRGMNMGLMQVTAVGLFSTLLGPIIQVALAESIGWRATFLVTIIPGIIIAICILKVLINPKKDIAVGEEAVAELPKGTFIQALKNRNVLLSMIGTLFLLLWYVNMLTYCPLFLTEVGGMSPSGMSIVMSCFGVTAVVIGFALTKLSDIIGRKPVTLISTILAAIGTVLFILAVDGGMAENIPVMAIIAIVTWFGVGTCAMIQSTVPAESADPRFTASIIGSNQMIGELVGATLGATLLGFLADSIGLTNCMWILAASIFICFLICLGLKESAPLVLEKRAAKKAQQAA